MAYGNYVQWSGRTGSYGFPTPAGVGHQWTISTNMGHFKVILANESHWLQPVLVFSIHQWLAPTGVGRILVTNEPVEFEWELVEVHQDCMKITDHSRGIYRIHPNLVKKIRRMSICIRLDLQTLGSQLPSMPTNLPSHQFCVRGGREVAEWPWVRGPWLDVQKSMGYT